MNHKEPSSSIKCMRDQRLTVAYCDGCPVDWHIRVHTVNIKRCLKPQYSLVSFPNYSNSLLRFESQRGWSSRFKWLGERSASKWRSIWFLKVISHWKKCYRFSSLLYVVGITNYQQYKWFFLMTSFRWSRPRLDHYQVKISSIVIVREL